MSLNFAGKTAIVTGGANGIGLSIAEHFLDVGADVFIIDIDKAAWEALAARHDGLKFFHGDIGEKTTSEAFISALPCPINFLINNACISHGGLLSVCPYEDFERMQRVGVTAPYYLTSLLLQQSLLAKDAAIINIASTRADQSQPDTEAYTAAKGGIIALTHAMAISLAGQARVNAISPGWIETDKHNADHTDSDKHQHPARRIGIPNDIAQMTLFLCDNEKSGFITGQNFTIDGGMSKLMIYHNAHNWKFDKDSQGVFPL